MRRSLLDDESHLPEFLREQHVEPFALPPAPRDRDDAELAAAIDALLAELQTRPSAASRRVQTATHFLAQARALLSQES